MLALFIVSSSQIETTRPVRRIGSPIYSLQGQRIKAPRRALMRWRLSIFLPPSSTLALSYAVLSKQISQLGCISCLQGLSRRCPLVLGLQQAKTPFSHEGRGAFIAGKRPRPTWIHRLFAPLPS
ncbi:uncharacterized protein VTP21DRAFT_4133 [Calcarisporiella thermophila]|uniref:uncharacterized protein n=1 Tax=Calcarisporiella thermophila TaxID=911321 RepID=UPI003742624C